MHDRAAHTPPEARSDAQPAGQPAAQAFTEMAHACRRRRLRVATWRRLGDATLAALVLLNMLLLIRQLGFGLPSQASSGWALTAPAVLFAAVFLWLSRGQEVVIPAVLLELDQRLGTRERFITAWEVAQDPQQAASVADLLLRQATTRLANVQPEVMWRVSFSAHAKFAPLLIALAIVIAMVELPIPNFISGVDPQVEQTGEELRRFAENLARKAETHQLSLARRAARRLEAEGKLFQRQAMNSARARQRMAALQRDLQRWQDAAQRSIGNQRHADIGEAVSMLHQRQNLQQQLQELARQSRVENLSARDAAALRRHQALLRQLLDARLVARAQRLLERGMGRIVRGNDRRESEGQQGGGEGRGAIASLPEPPGDKAEGKSGVGKGTQPALSTTPRALQQRQTILLKTPSQLGPGTMRKTIIRSLPLRNEANRPEQEVLTTYQRQAESMLTRESLPRQYRNFIRDYFLSIGLAAPSPSPSDSSSGGPPGANEEP